MEDSTAYAELAMRELEKRWNTEMGVKVDFFLSQFLIFTHYCAAGTIYLVQKVLYELSILEGEIRSRTDEKRPRTDENDLSLVAAP